MECLFYQRAEEIDVHACIIDGHIRDKSKCMDISQCACGLLEKYRSFSKQKSGVPSNAKEISSRNHDQGMPLFLCQELHMWRVKTIFSIVQCTFQNGRQLEPFLNSCLSLPIYVTSLIRFTPRIRLGY